MVFELPIFSCSFPRYSMGMVYFSDIYHKNEPNVGKYTSPIECLGFRSFKRLAVFCWLFFFSMFFRAAFVDTRCEKLQARHDEE